MALVETFDDIVGSLPDDWTDLELDLRIFDEKRYIDAALSMVVCNALPYSKYDWHWRIICAHRFGHAAAPSAVRTSLKLLDEAGIEGETAVRRVTSGRVEVVPTWDGRSPSARSSAASAAREDRRRGSRAAVRVEGGRAAAPGPPRRPGRAGGREGRSRGRPSGTGR